MPDIYECDDYDQDEDYEPESDYDAMNDDRAIEEWEASRPVMVVCDSGQGGCPPF